MSYLPGATEVSFPQPLVGKAIARVLAADSLEDPLQAWLGLMQVIEALCPEGLPHATTSGVEFRL